MVATIFESIFLRYHSLSGLMRVSHRWNSFTSLKVGQDWWRSLQDGMGMLPLVSDPQGIDGPLSMKTWLKWMKIQQQANSDAIAVGGQKPIAVLDNSIGTRLLNTPMMLTACTDNKLPWKKPAVGSWLGSILAVQDLRLTIMLTWLNVLCFQGWLLLVVLISLAH